MLRKLAALILAAVMIFSVCGYAQEAGDVTPEPAIEATAEPTVMPAAEPTAEITAQPTEAPTQEATAEPSEEPSKEPSAEPTSEVTAEPTSEVTATPTDMPTDAPTEEPTAGPTAAPTVDPACEAWFVDGEGTLVWGGAEEIFLMTQPGDIVYINSDVPVIIRDVTIEDIEQRVFLPDGEKFGEDFRCIYADEAPKGCVPPEDVESYVYIWVEEIPEETPEPTAKPTATPVPEMEIRVDAKDYEPGKWSNKAVTFTLSGIPENSERYAYAVIAYDERFIILSGNTYTCDDEGKSDLRFVILDGIGDVAARSVKYDPMLDLTGPNAIYVQMKEGSYKKYFVTAEDELSGISAYSNDGGETWKEPDEEGKAAFKGESGDVVPAGMILAKDGAGNVSAYEADFYLPEKMPPFYGGGGNGGGGEDETPHAPPAEETDLNPYNALELEISEEPMSALVMGETELPLTIELDYAGEFEIPEEHEAFFTARLEKWGPAEEDTEEEEPDTLVISAVMDENIEGEYAYMFSFNGIVYRMLMNSGIDYLVFETQDGIAALSTAGFTAGTEFTRLKAEGVSTKYMDYAIRLAGDMDNETPVEMVMEMEVTLEGYEEIYPLVDEVACGDGTMYYYDVQVGPAEMMDVPFGAWVMDGTHMDDMGVTP